MTDNGDLLDLRGEPCPVPLIRALKALAKLENGETLRILVDMPCAVEKVPRHLADEGHEVSVVGRNGEVEIVVRKRGYL